MFQEASIEGTLYFSPHRFVQKGAQVSQLRQSNLLLFLQEFKKRERERENLMSNTSLTKSTPQWTQVSNTPATKMWFMAEVQNSQNMQEVQLSLIGRGGGWKMSPPLENMICFLLMMTGSPEGSTCPAFRTAWLVPMMLICSSKPDSSSEELLSTGTCTDVTHRI